MIIRTSPAWDPLLHPQAQGSNASEYLAEGAATAPFNLHSNPSADKVIFLDFNGENVTGTTWNLGNTDFVDDMMMPLYPVPTIFALNFSIDGDLSFSATELQMIERIWQRVSEDFAPFNVDVTTEQPEDNIIDNGVRVVISGSSNDWWIPPGEGAIGGVAYVGSFTGTVDNICWVFPENLGAPGNAATIEKNVAEAISHETGHTLGLIHDGEKMPFTPNVEYYAGHGAGATGWAPIMGVGYGQELVQWSKGEYPWANNIGDMGGDDDLDIITTMNGFDYKDDDHANTIDDALFLDFDRTSFSGQGIIERNDDLDFFAIPLSVESVVINIDPFILSPNLDILATLYNSAGEEIATSNPIDALNATFSINTEDAGSLTLPAGIYYLSIDGTGKPQTTDFGYSDYGSLGQYTISASRESHLNNLVGVDFDVIGGPIPTNWTRYTGGTLPPNHQAVLSNLKDELGTATDVNLIITSSKSSIPRFTNTLNPDTVPLHPAPLTQLGGYIADTNVNWTFQWSDLDPLTVYEFYVFGAHGTGGGNQIHVTGYGSQAVDFTQPLLANELYVNGEAGGDLEQLINYSRTIRSNVDGTITITVANQAGLAAGLAGLAIRPAINGSIFGQKWNDLNGDGIKDPDEPGLGGWTIFLDDNDNGLLDVNFPQNAPSVDVPQVISDLTTVKSELLFEGIRTLSDIDVTLDITHGFDADVNVFLISPLGTRVELFSDVGAFNDNFTNTTLDDEASLLINAGAAPFTGRFRPEGLLSSFDGEDPNGVWTLEISDDAPGDPGVLNSWSLNITGSEGSTVTDGGGNYSFDNLDAGVYNVKEVLAGQTGWVQTFASPPVTINSAASVLDVDFGNWVPVVLTEGSISGQKWNDLNGDGIKDSEEPGLADWRIYVDENNNGMYDPEIAGTFSSTDVPQNIVDLSTVIAPLVVDVFGSVVSVEVKLDISHSFDADLDVFLISPSGRQIELFSGVGGQFNNFTNTTFSDNAAVSVLNGTAPFTGSYRPEGLLSDYIDDEANGTWQLLIRDTAFGDVGTLNSWSLDIVHSERSTLTDENGQYIFEDLQPGTYVIGEVLQPGWIQTAPLIPNAAPYYEIELAAGDAITDMDFGNQEADFLLGDYNTDGTVDTADFIIWRFTMGDTVTPFSGADGDGSGVIDQGDYNLWRAHFGDTLSPGAGSAAVVVAEVAQPGVASAVAVEQPAPQPVAVHATAVVAEFHGTAERDAEQGSNDAASQPAARTEAPSLTISRSTPRVRGKFTPASAARDIASNDAAILAWLSAGSRVDRSVLGDDFGIATADKSRDGNESDSCDLVDVVFEAIGTA